MNTVMTIEAVWGSGWFYPEPIRIWEDMARGWKIGQGPLRHRVIVPEPYQGGPRTDIGPYGHHTKVHENDDRANIRGMGPRVHGDVRRIL